MHLICTRIIEVRPRGLCASSCCCCIHIARPYQVFTIVLQLQPYSCTQRKQADVNDCTRPTAVSPRSNRSGGLITPNVVQRVIACMRPRLLPKSLGDSIRQAPGGMRFEIQHCLLALYPTAIQLQLGPHKFVLTKRLYTVISCNQIFYYVKQ